MNYRLDPDLIFKNQEDQLLLISVDPARDDLLTLEGQVANIIIELSVLSAVNFTQFTLLNSCKDARPVDLDSLWKFCLEKKILIPV